MLSPKEGPGCATTRVHVLVRRGGVTVSEQIDRINISVGSRAGPQPMSDFAVPAHEEIFRFRPNAIRSVTTAPRHSPLQM
jgi:hypothetical protein